MVIFILVAISLAFVALAAGYFFHAGKSAVDRIIHRIVATVLAAILAVVAPYGMTLALTRLSQFIMRFDFFNGAVMGTSLYVGIILFYWWLTCRLTHLGGELNYPRKVRQARKRNPEIKKVVTIKEVDRAWIKFRQENELNTIADQ